ncbi:MAG TPA: hypothetical protein DCZ34_00665, partial [Clostridiales bacterium]|nr:hypothetical protein [Clostridiales bacterium]
MVSYLSEQTEQAVGSGVTISGSGFVRTKENTMTAVAQWTTTSANVTVLFKNGTFTDYDKLEDAYDDATAYDESVIYVHKSVSPARQLYLVDSWVKLVADAENVVITRAFDKPMFYVEANERGGIEIGDVNMPKLTIDGGNRAYSIFELGGAADQYLVLSNCLVTGNASGAVTNNASQGGAVLIGAPSTYGRLTFIMEDSTITNCGAGYGGGIYITGDMYEFSMENSTISNCTATSFGGAIWIGGNEITKQIWTGDIKITRNTANAAGGGIHNAGTLTLNNCTISDNISNNYGGGLSSVGSLTLESDVVVSDNTARRGGGGICFRNGNSLTVGCVISGNTSSSSGGGIYFDGSKLIVLSQCRISNNKAANGGGIALASADTDDSIISGTIIQNTATNYGGGIVVRDSTLTIDSCNIYGNSALSGGGVYIYEGATAIIIDTTISNNESTYSSLDGTVAGGGGVFNAGTLEINIGTISGNTATTNGGGICNTGKLTIYNGTISDNKATNDGGGIYNAGALYLHGGIIGNANATSIATSTSYSNYAGNNGGGIWFSSQYFDWDGAITIFANYAGNNGGGFYWDGSNTSGGGFRLLGLSIKYNYSELDGGGIWVSEIQPAIMESILSTNGAGNNGGGIFVKNCGKIYFRDSTEISNNFAGNNGGGIYFDGENIYASITDAKIDGNTAVNGGAIASTCTSVDLTIDVEITNNKAKTGGAIWVENGKLSISGSGSLKSNTAETVGGAIVAFTGSVMIITGLTIESNVAGRYGGAIAYRGTSLTGSVSLNSNKAERGAGLYILSTGAEFSSLSVYMNTTSSGAASGIYARADFTVNANMYMCNELTLDKNAKLIRKGITNFLSGGESTSCDITVLDPSNGRVLVDYSDASNTDTLTSTGSYTLTNAGYKLAVSGKKLVLNTIQYTITYALNGGSDVATSQTYNIETNLTLLGTPAKTGYTFGGWKVTTAGGNWTNDTTFTASQNIGTGKYGNITLTAQWTPIQYTITYALNGGSGVATSQTYNIET